MDKGSRRLSAKAHRKLCPIGSAQDVFSYREMCELYGVSLQRGMNYRMKDSESLILMSIRPVLRMKIASSKVDESWLMKGMMHRNAKKAQIQSFVDQAEFHGDRRTQNGLFIDAVRRFKSGKARAERVRIFEKVRDGIWAYNGVFELVDGWLKTNARRQVFKFNLQLLDEGITPF